MYRNYYEILGISPLAGSDDIKKAYRKLAMKYHPDSNPGLDAKDRFIEINKAYEVLNDPQKRWRYDLLINTPTAPPQTAPPPPPPPDYSRPDPRYYQAKEKKVKEEQQEFLKYSGIARMVGIIAIVITSIIFLDMQLASLKKGEKIIRRGIVNLRAGGLGIMVVTDKDSYKFDRETGKIIQKGDSLFKMVTPFFGKITQVEIYRSSPLKGTKLLPLYQREDHPDGMIKIYSSHYHPSIYNIFVFVPIIAFLSGWVCVFLPKRLARLRFQFSLLGGMFTFLSILFLLMA